MSKKFIKMVTSVSRLDRLIRKGKTDGTRDLGLKSSHTLLLYLLEQKPEGYLFADLCQDSDSDSGLCSRTLKELRQAGLVEKIGEEGRYKALYFLSEEGRKQAQYISQRIDEAETLVREGISEEDMETFYKVAQALAVNLEQLPAKWRKTT